MKLEISVQRIILSESPSNRFSLKCFAEQGRVKLNLQGVHVIDIGLFLLPYNSSIKKDQCHHKLVIFSGIGPLLAKFFTHKIWEISPSK